MENPFIGQIIPIAFNFAPRDWSYCDGQLLPITQNAALYSLLSTQFGGNGRDNFALPDLRGRVPVHPDYSTVGQGTIYGFEQVTLDSSELPAHTHPFVATNTDGSIHAPTPTGAMTLSQAYYAGGTTRAPQYAPPTGALVPMDPGTCTAAGGNQSHYNCQPSLVIAFVIALAGAYPSRN